jgi:hypothetical protein
MSSCGPKGKTKKGEEQRNMDLDMGRNKALKERKRKDGSGSPGEREKTMKFLTGQMGVVVDQCKDGGITGCVGEC